MNCMRCNDPFVAIRSNQKYCSKLCYQNSKHQRSYDKKRFKVLCKFCKKEFNGGRKEASYCSDDCMWNNLSIINTKYIDIPSCLESADRKIDKNLGYVRVYAPMHIEANTWGYVYEHRIIAEQMMGRSLLKNEIVHHKNGKRWDNRSENLEVMNKHDHAKLHGQREEDLLI